MLKAIRNLVIVRPTEVPDVTPNGVHLVSSEKPTQGRVLVYGEEVTGISINDDVIYAKYGGTSFKDEQWGTVLILRDIDILGIVYNEPQGEA